MATSSNLPKLFALCLFLITLACRAQSSQIEDSSIQLMTDALEWPSAMSLYDEELVDEDGDTEDGAIDRRLLFWRALRYYYISYGALSANRIPCPPRSGRSYYTNNCYKARGPVRPYTRGCSRITRCRR